MADVVSLRANPGVVNLLTQMLERAKKGEISDVCVTYVEFDQNNQENIYLSSWSGSRFTLLGALGRAMFAVNLSWGPNAS